MNCSLVWFLVFQFIHFSFFWQTPGWLGRVPIKWTIAGLHCLCTDQGGGKNFTCVSAEMLWHHTHDTVYCSSSSNKLVWKCIHWLIHFLCTSLEISLSVIHSQIWGRRGKTMLYMSFKLWSPLGSLLSFLQPNILTSKYLDPLQTLHKIMLWSLACYLNGSSPPPQCSV